jgi:serine/threonine-protein kinase
LTESTDGRPLVKVLDFGVAKVPSLDDLHGTRTGSVIGTPLYMSPEQASGADVGPSADVWSIGLCAFRLLSGKDYWTAPNVTLLLAKIVYEPILPPIEVGLDLGTKFDAWFLRSCARDPANRWPSVGLQVEGLASALGYPEVAISVPTPQPSPFHQSHEDVRPWHSDLRGQSLDGSATAAPTQQFKKPSALVLGVAFGGALAAAALLFYRTSSSISNATGVETARPPAPLAATLTAPSATPLAPPPVDTATPASPPATSSSAENPSTAASKVTRDRLAGGARVSRRAPPPAPSVAVPPPSTAETAPRRPRDPLADPD